MKELLKEADRIEETEALKVIRELKRKGKFEEVKQMISADSA